MAKLRSREVVNAGKPAFHDVVDWYNQNLHPDSNDYDDQDVYRYVYHDGRFPGIFQLTSTGAQRLFMAAKPRSITDIAVLTSIYRPGPLAADVDKLYLKARAGEKYDWGHPLFETVLGKTDNCLAGDTRVMTLNGELTIKEIVDTNMIGLEVLSFCEATSEVVKDRIVGVASNGIKNLIEIETDIGILKLTEDHRVMTQRGWISAGELTLEDEIFSVMENNDGDDKNNKLYNLW